MDTKLSNCQTIKVWQRNLLAVLNCKNAIFLVFIILKSFYSGLMVEKIIDTVKIMNYYIDK